MMVPAFVHPRPAAVIEQGNRRWTFHRVAEPVTQGIPHFEVKL